MLYIKGSLVVRRLSFRALPIPSVPTFNWKLYEPEPIEMRRLTGSSSTPVTPFAMYALLAVSPRWGDKKGHQAKGDSPKVKFKLLLFAFQASLFPFPLQGFPGYKVTNKRAENKTNPHLFFSSGSTFDEVKVTPFLLYYQQKKADFFEGKFCPFLPLGIPLLDYTLRMCILWFRIAFSFQFYTGKCYNNFLK